MPTPKIHDAYAQIMSLGKEEQASIAAGNTEDLEHILAQREKAIYSFLESAPEERDELFLKKLINVQKTHAQLHNEVKALHQSLKEELSKIRSENRRFGGYKNGAQVTPLTSRLLNKTG
ncbi:MAG: hypothetical protein RBR42_07960 [Desulfomicrobium sp.]|jgi:predicted  nucleic acid-binding Zn-ribbon protein|nr:hypothetical protein [Desulfomicrobium sp.]